MTTPSTLRQQALDAARQAIRDGQWWLPPAGQAQLVDAVLAIAAPAPQPDTALKQILADANHHDLCATESKTPEGGISHSSIAAGLRIAARHLLATQKEPRP